MLRSRSGRGGVLFFSSEGEWSQLVVHGGIAALDLRVSIASRVLTGGGFASSQFTKKGTGINQVHYEAAGVSGLGNNKLKVSVGGLGFLASIPNTKLPVKSIAPVVLTDIVYHDDPVIRIAVQARSVSRYLP